MEKDEPFSDGGLKPPESPGSLAYGTGCGSLNKDASVVGCSPVLYWMITLYMKGMRPSMRERERERDLQLGEIAANG